MNTELAVLDDDVRLVSACSSFADLMATSPTYCPSLRADFFGEAALRVARAFDAEASRRGEKRSSYVYYTRRDGKVGTCFGTPRGALSKLLAKVIDEEALDARERITLRGLIEGCPFDAKWLDTVKAKLGRYNGRKAAHEAIEKAVGIVFVGGFIVVISPRSRARVFRLRHYADSYVKKAGAVARIDLVNDSFVDVLDNL